MRNLLFLICVTFLKSGDIKFRKMDIICSFLNGEFVRLVKFLFQEAQKFKRNCKGNKVL